MSCYIPQLSHTHTNQQRKREILPPDVVWVWELQPGGYQTCLTLRSRAPLPSCCFRLPPFITICQSGMDFNSTAVLRLRQWPVLTHQSIMKEKTQGELANQSAGTPLDGENRMWIHNRGYWVVKGKMCPSLTGWHVSIMLEDREGQKSEWDKKNQHLFILKIEVYLWNSVYIDGWIV